MDAAPACIERNSDIADNPGMSDKSRYVPRRPKCRPTGYMGGKGDRGDICGLGPARAPVHINGFAHFLPRAR